MPMVTAIVPVFNAEAEVLNTIKSLQAQTFSDWEAVVIDDGSTDQTAKVVDQAKSEDPRLHLWTLSSNQGRGAARNAALRKVRGEFIAFCDAGDESPPYRFAESLAHFAARPEAACVSAQIARRVAGREVTDPHFMMTGAEAAAALRRGLMRVATPTAMVRRSSLPPGDCFHDSLRRCEDVFFFVRLARSQPLDAFIVSPLVFTYYNRRVHTPWRYWRENAMYSRLASRLLESDGSELARTPELGNSLKGSLRLTTRESAYEFARWFAVDQRNRLRTFSNLKNGDQKAAPDIQ